MRPPGVSQAVSHLASCGNNCDQTSATRKRRPRRNTAHSRRKGAHQGVRRVYRAFNLGATRGGVCGASVLVSTTVLRVAGRVNVAKYRAVGCCVLRLFSGRGCAYSFGHAVVAKLADALDSGSSGVTPLEVQVLSTALVRMTPPSNCSAVCICGKK